MYIFFPWKGNSIIFGANPIQHIVIERNSVHLGTEIVQNIYSRKLRQERNSFNDESVEVCNYESVGVC